MLAKQGEYHPEPGGEDGEPEHPGDHGGECFQPVARLEGLEVDADIGASLIDYRYYRGS